MGIAGDDKILMIVGENYFIKDTKYGMVIYFTTKNKIFFYYTLKFSSVFGKKTRQSQNQINSETALLFISNHCYYRNGFILKILISIKTHWRFFIFQHFTCPWYKVLNIWSIGMSAVMLAPR